MGRYDASLRTAKATQPTPIVKVHLNGRELFTAMDAEASKRMNGAGYGTTQFDSNHSIPPLFIPATK